MNAKQVIEAAVSGEGCLGKSAPTEPVFVLCARDPFAPRLVRDWARAAEQVLGNSHPKIRAARSDAEAMLEWQDRHGRKIPD